MSDRPFHILHVDLETGQGKRSDFAPVSQVLGGSGLAAALFEHYGDPKLPAHHPSQPLIFAIGPLTGIFPLMSKVVCAFKSPYNEEYAESHAGGRLALSMRFAGYDAIVVTGQAKELSFLSIGGRKLHVEGVEYLRGRDVFSAGKYLRKRTPTHGHGSIIRIGPAGENQVAYACINVDSFRHFGRLGSGAVMGAKNLKGIAVIGDRELPLPDGKEYKKQFKEIYAQVTSTGMMSKYHNLGTAENLLALNELRALPWDNLRHTTRPEIDGISGERFAEQLLLRQTACAGCPVGCIHIGLLREKFADENEYLYRQVSYDYEPIFACGSMLGLTAASDVLTILDECERQGLDVMSAGVALAWAAEALDKGIITEKETLVPLVNGEKAGFADAVALLGGRVNEFYRLLGEGTLKAAAHYGGEDFACVLGQEMAGYATGEVYFVSQALGFRHSHLDSGAYSYDQKKKPGEKDADDAVAYMIEDERMRVMLTSMVSCLFARKVYDADRLREALRSVGLSDAADRLDELAREMQILRWRMKIACGFDPRAVKIPRRFLEVETWKGTMDEAFLNELKEKYAAAILDLAGGEE
ncbi:aldehyde:ferredoxin oxidoreductase [Desulfobaculum xiamenense]|uniref:Aldehyde:ferredoxin oxidoreductase n=1 Tax=Desulfobaculum xiamenense TaxID=995050 RepID=A0A846QLF5_9BACT|nr:aldehyde ferredoxin oxidoreductase N-terminal domain-containing protein [Desulfobaculum xiamenense]NJB67880.1 aldehyde:ferredoxin oxidoreductase [Desulfobaculum xiamenense]